MRFREVTWLQAVPMGTAGECKTAAGGSLSMGVKCLQFTKEDGTRASGKKNNLLHCPTSENALVIANIL